jgi:hypothetical protein
MIRISLSFFSVPMGSLTLNQRVPRPPVQRKVRVDVLAIPGAIVHDDLGTAGLPSLAADPVLDILPRRLVGSVQEVVVGDGAATLSPERVEVAAMEAVTVAVAALTETTARLPSLERRRLAVEFITPVEGGKGRHRRSGKEEGGEQHRGNPFAVKMVVGASAFSFRRWGNLYLLFFFPLSILPVKVSAEVGLHHGEFAQMRPGQPALSPLR